MKQHPTDVVYEPPICDVCRRKESVCETSDCERHFHIVEIKE